MTDRLEKLEAELVAMRPSALTKDLERRIGREIAGKQKANWGDRRLLSAMAMGAMAACVILTVLVRDGAMNGAATRQPAAVQLTPTSAGYPMLMAWADSQGLGELK